MAAVALLVEAQRAGRVDPLGLEPRFPGLIAESVWMLQGVAQGDVANRSDFATFNTFGYAVLHLTSQRLDVQVTASGGRSANSARRNRDERLSERAPRTHSALLR